MSIVQYPNNINFTGNPINIVADSTDTNEEDFNYICDIYVGSDRMARLRSFPDPEFEYGHFEISDIVRDLVSFNFDPSAGIQLSSNKSLTNLTIDIRQSYLDDGDYTESQIEEITDVLILSGTLPYNEFVDNDVDFTNFLNYPDNIIYPDEHSFLHFFNDDADSVFISTYGNDGSLIGEYSDTVSGDYIILSTGTATLNDANLNVESGPSDVINDNVRSYTVQLIDDQVEPVSNIVTYTINRCSNMMSENKVRLHFLNKYGAFDSFTFDKKNYKRHFIERRSVNSRRGSLTATGISYNKHDSIRRSYMSDSRESLALNSDYLKDKQFTWLFELASSPITFIEDKRGILSAHVTDVDYDESRKGNNKLNQLLLRVELDPYKRII